VTAPVLVRAAHDRAPKASADMTLHVRILVVSVALVAAALMENTPARAAGSLGLVEVLAAVAASPTLVAEIRDELGRSGLAGDEVICSGARHGGHWIYLGGMRAAPYTCTIGKRELTIEADRIYFNARGKAIGDADRASPRRARTFRESNFRWSWSD
jgi:hypothetical protein